jgi:hypothetical protein
LEIQIKIFKLLKANFESPYHFLTGQKVTKNPQRDQGPLTPPFIRPGLLQGRHHPWSFDWLPSVGFRSRPLFFILEKKRRRRYP